MQKIPSVSVIIPAYCAQKTIARAIHSALVESDVAEVIVVDDASNDKTIERAQKCDDGTGRLKILVQPENKGPSAARNRAIDESSAPWIALLDSDDFFLPGRIKGLLAHTEKTDLIADDLWKASESAPDGPFQSLLGEPQDLPRTITLEEFVLSNVTKRGQDRAELGFIKPLMRRNFLKCHAISYREEMRLGEDYEFYTRALAAGGRLVLIPAQGYVVIVRSGSLSNSHTESDLQALRDCSRAIEKDLDLNKNEYRALQKHYRDTDCRLQWRLLILAVKNKDLRAALATFLRPWPVPLYLMEKLGEQMILRTFRLKKKQR